MNAEQKLRNIRAQVVLSYPFFGALLLKQKILELPAEQCETMATDGKNLYYNAEFITSTPHDELVFVVAHEALHPGFCHHTRQGERDAGLWNEACDYVINPILKDSGLHMPDYVLYRDDLRGMNAEQAYAKLAAERPPQPKDDGEPGPNGKPMPSYGGCGSVIQAPCGSESERVELENESKVSMTQATNFAQASDPGSVPGDVLRQIDELVNPQAPWRELLRRFMDQFAKADYTWASPNRRMIAGGQYLPSLKSEQLPPIAFVVDASGSMPHDSLTQAASELQSIMDDLSPEYVDVIIHDTMVRETLRFEQGEPIDLKVRAGGGTRFAPVCEALAESGEGYAVIVWFTDLQVRDWDACQIPDSPLLWIDYSAKHDSAPFGDEVIPLSDDWS